VRAVFGAIADSSEFDAAAATELGDERAREGVPLASVMEAYRVGFRGAWETMAEEAATRPRASREALRALTAKLLMAVHLAQTISEEVNLPIERAGALRRCGGNLVSSRADRVGYLSKPAAALGYCPCRGG
jgi:hypothetical protein